MSLGRWIASMVLVAAFTLIGAGQALAAGAPGSTSLHLTGQAVVEQGRDQQQLLLSADASDGSGWRLDVRLNPRAMRRIIDGSGAESQVVVLDGTYQLSGPSLSVISGPATGQITERGDGQVQLQPPSDPGTVTMSAPLLATFSVEGQGQLSLDLHGTLPVASASAAAPSTSQPVDHSFWYVSRAAGFTAYVLLTLTVCFGLLVRTHLFDAIVARWRSFDLHQFTALLALGFVVLHIVALLGDHYIGFQFDQLFVPLASPYRPVQVAIGIVAFYLLVLVIASFYVRRSISYGTWRAIHYLTFGVFALALGHGVLSGTDTGEPWARTIYWGTGLLVAALTVWRFTSHAGESRPRPVVVAGGPKVISRHSTR